MSYTADFGTNRSDRDRAGIKYAKGGPRKAGNYKGKCRRKQKGEQRKWKLKAGKH